MSQPDPLWIASAVWLSFGLTGLMLRRGSAARIAMALVALQGVTLFVAGHPAAGEGGQVLAVIGCVLGAMLAMLGMAVTAPKPKPLPDATAAADHASSIDTADGPGFTDAPRDE